MKRFLSLLLATAMMLSLCMSLEMVTALADGDTEPEHEHVWEEATCIEPKTCSVCGATDGEPKGHTVEEWTTTEKATCTEPGEKEGTCARCGQTITKEIAPKGHKVPDSWKTIQKPTSDDRTRIRVKYCERCGEECARQEKKLSKSEYKSWYKDQCNSISYKKLERSPRKYEGKMIKFSGYVFQVIYESDNDWYPSEYFIATDGKYDDLVYIEIYGDLSTRILKGDKISVWGEYTGIYTYETVRGSRNAIPSMSVEFYSIK